MYFQYVINWLYRCMQVPVPIVVSSNVYGLVTIFDLFLFTVYLGVFIVLIKYLITDTLSLNVGGQDISYSSNSYISKQYRNSVNKYTSKEAPAIEKNNRVRISKNSIAGHILSKKDK